MANMYPEHFPGESNPDNPEFEVYQVLRQLLGDVKAVLDGGVEPSQIVLIANTPKNESCIADVRQIEGHKLESMGRSYQDDVTSIRYTPITTFKGLEADVVFVLGCEGLTEKAYAETVYVQGSRARTLLYLYRPQVFKIANAS